jgi:transcriptional regulator with XRE-family HTH domain
MTNDDDVPALQSVAVRLQNWRQRRGLSISALAQAAKISKSTLSEFERNNGNPSLSTLWALAQALNIPLSFLFDDHDGKEMIQIVRGEDATVVAHEDPMYLAQLLGSWNISGELEIYLITLAEGVRRESDSHGFGVIEHAIAMSGRVDIGVSGQSAELGPGDMMTFPADQEHHYQAIAGLARLISIHQYPRGRPEPSRLNVDGIDQNGVE